MQKDKPKRRVYSFYINHNFSEWTEPKQLSTYIDGKQNQTKIIQSDKQAQDNYICYDIQYDHRINKEGYFIKSDGTDYFSFDYYFKKNRFNAYQQKKSHGYVLFDSSYKDVDNMLKSISGYMSKNGKKTKSNIDSPILLQKPDVNLKKVIEKAKIIGAWFDFGEVSIDHMKTSATFGLNVNESELFQQLTDDGGVLTAVTIKLDYNLREYGIIISTNGSITIQNNTQFKESIELTEYILDHLIS